MLLDVGLRNMEASVICVSLSNADGAGEGEEEDGVLDLDALCGGSSSSEPAYEEMQPLIAALARAASTKVRHST